jgi:hypothetical protein
VASAKDLIYNFQSMSNSVQVQGEGLEEILKTLEKFGFKFFGYSEDREPLVIAPNGQVVSVAIAYNFVKNQIQKSSSAGTESGIESMPDLANMPNFETAAESAQERGIESQTEQDLSKKLQPDGYKSITQNSPKMIATKPQSISLFGDGFPIKSFDPGEVHQVLGFIQKHSKSKDTTTKKWLAKQFEKFIAELQNMQ